MKRKVIFRHKMPLYHRWSLSAYGKVAKRLNKVYRVLTGKDLVRKRRKTPR